MITATLTASAPINPPLPELHGIKTLRRYGDPFMMEAMGLDTEYLGTSNFQNISLWTNEGGFGAIDQFYKLNESAMAYLETIQPNDGYLIERMNWLCGLRVGTPKRPYWTRGDDWNKYWTAFEFGTMVFGGQKIQVETFADGKPIEYPKWAKYQQRDKYETIIFYKLKCLRWVERFAVTHLTHPHFIQRCTWATWNTNPNNQYRDTIDSRVIFHPVWSPLDFPINNGATDLYIAKAFCL